MRLLIVSPHFPPQPSVAAQRVHALALAGAQDGHDVTVLTTLKRDDQRSRPAPCPGVRVVEIHYRAPGPMEWLRVLDRPGAPAGARPRGATLGQRLKSALLAPARALKARTGIFGSLRMPDLTGAWVRPASDWALAQPAFDAVVSSAGPYTAHLVALRLRRAGRVRVWGADFRDLWTRNHIVTGLFPFTLYERALERRVLARADVVTTVSEPLARTLRTQTCCPVEVIYNGFVAEPGFTTPPPPAPAPDDALVRLVYTGTLYPSGQDITPLMSALALVRDHHHDVYARLRLIVAGNQPGHWRARAASAGVVDRLEHLGTLPADAARQLQRDASALIVLEWSRPGLGVLTGKVFEYLAARAPILVTGGPSGEIIDELVTRCRRGVGTGRDARALADAITRIAQGQSVCAGDADEALIASFSRAVQSRRLLGLLRDRL